MKFQRGGDPREKMRIGQAALPLVIHSALKYTEEGQCLSMMAVDVQFLLDNMSHLGVSKLPKHLKFTLIHNTTDRRRETYSPEELIGREVHYNGQAFYIKP